MAGKTFLKNLCERPFNAIKEGQKKVEIRANNNVFSGNSVNLIGEGDFIIFKRVDGNEKIKCSVERKTLYKSVKELLESEGTEHTLSSTNNIEEGIKSVESIGNYKELIAKNGVFAIRLKDVEVLNDS